jgi:hypothetical protein
LNRIHHSITCTDNFKQMSIAVIFGWQFAKISKFKIE